jgi:bacteriocin-like protein
MKSEKCKLNQLPIEPLQNEELQTINGGCDDKRKKSRCDLNNDGAVSKLERWICTWPKLRIITPVKW